MLRLPIPFPQRPVHTLRPLVAPREAYQRAHAEVPLLAKLPLLSRGELLSRAAALGLTQPVAPGTAGAKPSAARAARARTSSGYAHRLSRPCSVSPVLGLSVGVLNRPPPAAGDYLQELRLRGGFRAGSSSPAPWPGRHAGAPAPLEGAAAAESAEQRRRRLHDGEAQERCSKRRRWAREQLAAMGSPLALASARLHGAGTGSGSSGAGGGEGTLDLLTFSRSSLSQCSMPLVAADCSVVASQLGSSGADTQVGGPLVLQQRLAWVCASPLTGSSWVRTDS
jgi:hypothetical protein